MKQTKQICEIYTILKSQNVENLNIKLSITYVDI